MQKVNAINPAITFSFAHVNDPCLLSDIPNLGYENLRNLGLNQFENLNNRNGTIYFNTWYAQQNWKYMNIYGMTLDCLYAAFNDSCKNLLGFTLDQISNEPSSFIPTIDYSKFPIQNAAHWIHQNPHKKIFISNGHALSGQATNFPMAPVIVDLAQAHKEKIFILSNQEGNLALPPNVIYSKDIIQKPTGSDLNENSFITTYCDVIVGRASGVFSYAWTQQNMLQRNVKFVCFCGPGVVIRGDHQFWTDSLLSGKIPYSAQYIVNHSTDPGEFRRTIESNL